MELIRSVLLRSGTFWAGVALVTALFSGSAPALATSRLARLRHTSLQHNKTRLHSRHHSQHRWLEVNLSQQRLIAWEGGQRIYSIPVSTGKHSTPTLQGTFAIQSKLRFARMQGADYDVPNVPYTMYFAGGYAIHGAYWHHEFGTPVSHGCVNLPVRQASSLFRWASVGTQVVIHG